METSRDHSRDLKQDAANLSAIFKGDKIDDVDLGLSNEPCTPSSQINTPYVINICYGLDL